MVFKWLIRQKKFSAFTVTSSMQIWILLASERFLISAKAENRKVTYFILRRKK